MTLGGPSSSAHGALSLKWATTTRDPGHAIAGYLGCGCRYNARGSNSDALVIDYSIAVHWLQWLGNEAHWAILVAGSVALGFRRNRFVLCALVLGGALLAGNDASVQFVTATLFLALVALPEPALLSWRSALFALACGMLAARTAVILDWAGAVVEWGSAMLTPAVVSLACVVALSRWLLRGLPLDLFMALSLAPMIAATLRPDMWNAGLGLCSLLLAASVLIGAYRMAFVDALTGLPNRRALDEALSRTSGRIAVAMVDVDHFKKFNDRYGHETGDQVLRIVARELKRCRGGRAYRYGGEEFAIVFEGHRIDSADQSLEAMRGAIEARRVRLGSRSGKSQAVRRGSKEGEVSVTVSIGLAQRDRERRTSDAIIDAADKALYRSKQRGRNRLTLAPGVRAA